MKVLLVNGSPRINGCTNRALEEVKAQLKKNGIESYILWLGVNPPHCDNCRYCKEEGHSCKHEGVVNHLICQINMHDAVIFGSPVYYGGISSQLKAVLTCLFYSDPKCMRGKPVAGVFSSRRAGSTSALSEFNLPFLMHSCNIIGSQYWNEVHGDTPEEVELDYEGLQTMRTLANNMTTVLGVEVKEEEEKIRHLNFISREYKALLEKEPE
ncbi:MAG: flavodoxin family protein [Bacilli bacterium]|nr:flavodoxin family protein [Bacilli bacterium]